MLANSIDLNFITTDAVILTPNMRLANFLLSYYQQKQTSYGHAVWEKP